jgi:hypothetical protein
MLRVLSVVAPEMETIGSRVYPQRKPRKRSIYVLLVLAALPAGCGGGGSKQTASATQQVAGAGFRFDAPAGWQVTGAGRHVTVKQGGGSALASVDVLPLLKRYQPALFTRAIGELDRVTAALAAKLGGKVIARRTIIVGGFRARQYDLAYTRAGTALVERIAYVLREKSEYYLLCRWSPDEGEPSACALLTSSFRLG